MANSLPNPPRSRRRTIIYRLIAVLSPLVLLGLLNFVLYVFGAGHDTRLIVSAETRDRTVYRLNGDASYAYFLGRRLVGPHPRHFHIPKPANVFRTVVVGASTVEGFPCATELAFPRQLELLLSLQCPDRRVEVVNVGIVGIGSFSLVDVVRQVLTSQPDLIVVYAGHNEFYGPGGVGSSATRLTPSLYPVFTELRRFRLWQTVVGQIQGPAAPTPLIEALPADMAIGLDSAKYRAAEHYYRRNLTRIVQLAESHRTAILLCGVACNLRDQSPMHSIPASQIRPDEAEARDSLLQRVTLLLQQNRPAVALEAADRAAKIDEGYALTAYRRGQCLEALGESQPAAEAFQRACDLDGCRFRAPGSFREIAREVVDRPARRQSCYVDIARELAVRSEYAAPGHDLFMEHVHFHREGHWQVALILAKAIVEDVLAASWKTERVPSPAERDAQLEPTIFDDLVAYGFAHDVVCSGPLMSAPDHGQQRAFVERRIQELVEATPPAEMQMFVQLDNKLRQHDLLNALGTALAERGHDQRAQEMFERAMRRRPWQTASHLGAAKVLNGQNQPLEALKVIRQAIAIAPHDPELQHMQAELEEIVRQTKIRTGSNPTDAFQADPPGR